MPQRSAVLSSDRPSDMHRRNSFHTDALLCVPLNIVFFLMENVLPQSLQTNFWLPLARLPLR